MQHILNTSKIRKNTLCRLEKECEWTRTKSRRTLGLSAEKQYAAARQV